MGTRICCVPGCNSNSKKKEFRNALKVPLFSLPHNPIHKEQWINTLKDFDSDFVPTTNSRICINHFKREDISYYYIQNRKDNQMPYNKVKLNNGVVPSVFPGMPHQGDIKIQSHDLMNPSEMTTKCVVKFCTQKFTGLYLFPKNKNVRKMWMDVIPFRGNLIISDDSKICEVHFKREDFHSSRGRQKRTKILKDSAVPSLFPSNYIHTNYKYYCYVADCENTKGRLAKEKGTVPFFKFPADEELKNKWLKNIETPFDTDAKNGYICMNHFKDEAIMKYLLVDGVDTSVPCDKIVLKPGAIPTEFPGKNHNMYNFTDHNKNTVCAVKDCRSQLDKNVPLFVYPSDPELQAKWKLVIPLRQKWKFVANIQVCKEHFDPISDFQHHNSNQTSLHLKDNAVPSIFSCNKTYDGDIGNIADAIEAQREFEKKKRTHSKDLVVNFDKLLERYRNLITEQTLAKYRARISSTCITFYEMVFSENGVPTIKSSARISDNLEIIAFVNDENVCLDHLGYTNNRRLLYYSQLQKILDFLSSDAKPIPINRSILANMTQKKKLDIFKKALNDMIEECDLYDDDATNELQQRLQRIYDHADTLGKMRQNYSSNLIVESAKFVGRYPECYELARKLVAYPTNLLSYMVMDEKNYPLFVDGCKKQKTKDK